MKNLSIGFIGLGLIGGSIAKSIRRVFPSFNIIAYNRSESARIAAIQEGTADIVCDKINDAFSNCDYIFLCTPVEYNVEYLRALKTIIKPTCIITDVGSTKTNIHEAVISEDMEENFIGGHPMAGSEKTGYSNSTAYLIENAFYVVTPTSKTNKTSLNELTELISKIGGIPVILDYKEHDYSVAAISHVPHIIAASLVNLVKDSDSPSETMKLLAAGGFKDITRIASSSPEMWQQICSSNSHNISSLLSDYISVLEEVKTAVDENDSSYIYNHFSKSREYRASFSDSTSGPITPTYTLYCDIADESGAISTVASILADNELSIKNIGIVHNREFDAGVLKIIFYQKESRDKAAELLQKHDYSVNI